MKIRKQDLQRIDDYVWAIPTSFHPEMNVPVWIVEDEPTGKRKNQQR